MDLRIMTASLSEVLSLWSRFGRQVPFAFLENVKNEFNQKYAEKSRTAQAGSLERAFG